MRRYAVIMAWEWVTGNTMILNYIFIGNEKMKKIILFAFLLLYSFCLAGNYQSESVSLFYRMEDAGSEPTIERKFIIDSAIRSLKVTGVWNISDLIYFYASHFQAGALLNWKENSFNATLVNSPTFVSDSGFYSDGATSYINSNYNPSTSSTNFTLNSGCVVVYSLSDVLSDNQKDIGSQNTSSSGATFLNSKRAADNQIYGALNTIFDYARGVIPSSLGLSCINRSNVNTTQFYKNGVAFGTKSTDVSTILPNFNLYILCYNFNGTPTHFSTRMLSFAYCGGSLTVAQQLSLFNTVEAYMDAVGAGVVAGTTEFPYPSLFETKKTFDYSNYGDYGDYIFK